MDKAVSCQRKIVEISLISEIGIQIGIGIDCYLKEAESKSQGIVVYCDNHLII
jgi:hypothetical protein